MTLTRISTLLVIALTACTRGPKAEAVDVAGLGAIDLYLSRLGGSDGWIGLQMWLTDFDTNEVCPEIPGVVVSIENVAAHVVSDGGTYTTHSEYAPLTPQRVCDDIAFEWWGPWSEVDGPTELLISDDTGSVSIMVDHAFSASELTMVSPADGVLAAGGEVLLSYTPADDVFDFAYGYLYSSEIEGSRVDLLAATEEDGLIHLALPETLDPALDLLYVDAGFDSPLLAVDEGVTGSFDRESATVFPVTIE